MSKRIAIQLFGHLRSFRNTYKSFLKYVVEANKKEGYEVDIFIHTWTETDHSDMTWHNQNGQRRGFAVTDAIKNEVISYYNPKKLLIEHQIETDDYKLYERLDRRGFSYKAILNLTYTVYKSSELRHEYTRETGIVYDYVIVTRPDILFYKPLSLNDFLSSYEKYKTEISNNGLFFSHLFFSDLANDKFPVYDNQFIATVDLVYFGTEEVIDKATGVFLKLSKESKQTLEEIYYHNNLWVFYWKNELIELIRIEYNIEICYTIMRTIEMRGGYKKYIMTSIIRFIKQVIKLFLPYGIIKIIRERVKK
jgi:hypothetical protein